MLTDTFRWRGDDVRWTRLGGGPPLVLCHGTPWSSALWWPIAEALSARFTTYLWDMAGYGESTMAPGQDVSLRAQGELFTALLRHWGLTGPDAVPDTGPGALPHVVAHDFGGAVALRAHLLHGAAYRSLALVDVVALAPWGSDFFRLVGANSEVFGAIPAVMHEALVRAYVGMAAARPMTRPAEDMLVGPWLGERGQAAFYRQIAQADQRYTDEIEPRYPLLRLPVTVLWGAEDSWIPVDRAHRLAALIPGARAHVVPDAGHLIQLDAPAALTGHLIRWLADVG